MTTHLGSLPEFRKTRVEHRLDVKQEKTKKQMQYKHGNPEVNANIFSQLLFTFVSPLVTFGFRQPLTPADMWPIADNDKCEETSAKLEKMWADERRKKGDKASLFNVSFRHFGINMLWIFLLTAISKAGDLAQPTILGKFIYWYVNPFAPTWEGYAWVVTFFAIPFISAIVTTQSQQIAMRGMIQLRGALASMVYDKSIRISSTSNVALPERQSKKAAKKAAGEEKKAAQEAKEAEAREAKEGEGKGDTEDPGEEKEKKATKKRPTPETTTGKIVNLMSADAEKVGMMMMMTPNSLIVPFQVAVNLVLIYQTMKGATFAGLGALILAAPFMGISLGRVAMYSQKQALITDQRLKIVNEILQGIRMVKFYAWETSFLSKVKILRSQELREIFRVTFSFQMFTLVFNIVPVIIPLATFSTYIYFYGDVDVVAIFQTLAYFQALQMPLVMIPMSLSQIGVGAVSARRLQTFLELPELDPKLVEPVPTGADYAMMVKGSFAYEPPSRPPVAAAKKGKKAPKQLEKTPSNEGLKNERKTERTLSNEGLVEGDSEVKPFQLTDVNFKARKGMLTAVIGSVGSGKSTLVNTLLGEMRPVKDTTAVVHCEEHVGYVAQKAWIQSCTIKENIMFGREFDEKRYEAVVQVCALAPDFASLPYGDETEIGDRGINLSGGQKQRIALARAVYAGTDCYLFDDPLSAVDANVGDHIMKKCFTQALAGKTRVLVMNQLHFLYLCDYIYVLDAGRVVAEGSFSQLNSNNAYFQKLVQEHAKSLAAASQGVSKAESRPGDEKELTAKDLGAATPLRPFEENLDRVSNEQMQAENIQTGRVKASGYTTHAKGMSWWLFILYMGFSAASQAGLSIGNGFVLSWWSSNKFHHDSWWYLELLGLVGLATAVCVFLRGIFFAYGTRRACGNYHENLFYKTLKAPSSFYDVTPVGRVLNRFSKDMNDIDVTLPRVLQGCVNIMLMVIGSLISTAVMTPLFLIVMGVVAILFIALQRYFSRSSIQLKRIEAVSRGPVYNHFGETLLGLATIRAFKHTERFRYTKVQRVNRMTHSFFSLRCVLNWASLRVGVINSLLLSFAVLFVTIAKGTLDPGSAALAVYFVLGIGPLLGFFVVSLTELDNNMNAVERVHEYSQELAQEASWDKDQVEVPADWPQEGKIELRDVVFRYRKNLDPVLHGLSASIGALEKIGVAGRTGSGKSSLMLCLFRMYEIDSGSILVDGIDISKLGLHTLRRKLAIIPQDPIVFSGTIRDNLDPFNHHDDAAVWEALELVQLGQLTKSMGGLGAAVKEYGENLSAGQRQLLCIARAVLRKPKILVMDEATSSVDSNTDTMIQNMVRVAFKNSTTVTIAHRLNTIMDSDRVMVLKEGNLVEFGPPQALVASGGVFSQMHHAMTH